jgi:NifU-like protein involved in Fe-S cluster formation
MSTLEDVYSERILELAANISHTRRLEAPDATATAHSKLCGSTVTVDLRLDGDRVVDYGQTVKACLLGQSSAAIMGKLIVGSTAAELHEVASAARAMLKEGAPPPAGKWADLEVLEPIRDFKSRHPSTLLVFDAVEKALDEIEAKRKAD